MAYSDRYPRSSVSPTWVQEIYQKDAKEALLALERFTDQAVAGRLADAQRWLQEAMWLANRARQWRTYDRYLRGDRSEELMQTPTHINLEREWDPEKRGTP